MDDPFIYGLLVLLLLLFLTLKSAFSSINQLQLELDKNKANYHSRLLNFIGEKIIVFSITINICYIVTLTILVSLLKEDLLQLFKPIPFSLYLLMLVVILGTIIFPIFKLFPKTLGEYFSNEIINIFAVSLIIIYIILYPFTQLLLFLSNTPFRLIYNNSIETKSKLDFGKEDLNKLVTDSQRHSSKNDEEEAEIKLFKNALEFSDVKIRECMVPRTEITAIEVNSLETEVLSKFISTGYSKIIIYRESIEDIIGYIKSNSLFIPNADLKSRIKSIKYFPESMPANKLLRYFIKVGQSIAVVVDEFGGTSGIVTIEDILEEIFGEIQDEHDKDDLIEKKISSHTYVLSGRIEIDYLNEKHSLNLPENEEYETIAGFILFYTENLPKVNDKIIIENFHFSILKVTDTRVDLVKLEILSEQE